MKRIIAITLMTIIVNFLQGQPITGTKTIPGDYATLASAISLLNTLGTTSPGVTFNIASGYTENVNANLTLTTNTSSASAPIVFQKVPGETTNPKLFASNGVWNSATDGAIIIAGSDFVTFDGIDITATDNSIDWGYGLVKRNSTAPFDGCQNVTIRNCSISLSQANSNSYGIYSGNHIATNTNALAITATTDACNNCRFYSNNISNVNNGIYLNGYIAPSPYTLYDQGNEIGVSGANNITNYGGAFKCYGIGATNQNALLISNNYITSSVNATASNSFYGISLTGGLQANSTISNNTISINLAAINSAVGVYCIYTQSGGSGTGNTLNITNNTIQNCSNPYNSSASFYCIQNSITSNGPGTINVNNNIIHDITMATSGSLYGVDAGSATNVNINSNTIYNLYATGTGYLYAIRSWTGNTVMHDNAVHDLTITSGSNDLCGYYNTASPTVESYYNNSFYNFNHNATGAVYGYYLNTTTGTRQTYGNTIHSFSSAGGAVFGMYHQSSSPVVYKNNIYDLTSLSSAGQVYGLYFYNGNNVLIHNNFISDLKAPASTGVTAVYGIYLNTPSPASLAYNTIYLNASSSSTSTFGTAGICFFQNYTTELKNNIVVNNSVPVSLTAPAYSVALQRGGSSSMSNYATTSNNNCYYAGNPGPNNLIYYDGTNADQSISLFKARVTPRETASFSEMPPFVDAANHNFHLVPAAITMLESSGLKITTPIAITNDYDNDIRWGETGYAGSGTATDVGADEGNFTPVSVMSFQNFTTTQVTGNTFAGTVNQAIIRMKITVTGAPSAINVTQFTCNASGTTAIADINATPSKIYYTGNSSFYGPGLLFGTASPTLANFTVAGSQTLSPGDNYFWLVYDIIQTATTGHILDAQCLGATIGGTVRVPDVTDPPGNMMILGPMTGTYLVGTGNTFPNFVTLTDAINNINHRGTLTPVVFSLTNSAVVPYNITNGEVFPITVGVIPLVSATNTVTIQPATGMSPVITGTSASSIINLNGTDYFIINGSNAGTSTRDLAIENLSTANWTAAVNIASLGSGAGATFCTIKNCILRAGLIGNGNTYTYALSAGSTVGSTGGDIDNLTVDNNEMSRAAFGLYIGATTSGTGDNLSVTNNTIGSDDPNYYLGNTGVYLTNVLGTFSNNVVKGVVSSATSTWGLYVGPGVKNMSFTKNDIHSIKGMNGNGGSGIVVDLASAGGNVTIANNVVYDITGDGSANLGSYGITGLKIQGYTTNLKVYYNSICLAGSINRSGATADMSAALYLGSSTAQIDVRNNIFSNSLENITGDAKAYAMYCTGTAATFTLDYNDYRVNGYEGMLASYNGVDQPTLVSWQAACGKDANSISADPNFNSPTVLIPYPGSVELDKCPALSVTDDYTGAVRFAPTSMGAYETGSDVTPPVVTYTPFYNTHLLTPRTLTTTIKDFYSSVPTAGAGLPRLYWKINNNPYNVVTGIWTSGNTYLFTFGNGVLPGNVVSYYFVCQDDAPTPNPGATPVTGAAGFTINPPACITAPSSPSSYTIVGALSGVKNIPGDYPNLTGANGLFADINSKSLSGNLTVNIAGNTTEDGTNALNEINTENPVYHLTIQNSGLSHKISGSYVGTLIRYNGADNVILNGKGKLTIINTNQNASVAIGLSGGCNNNLIDSCTIATGKPSNASNYGIYFSGPGNNNTISHDSIFTAWTGIYLNSTYWGLGSGNIITGNNIGSATVANSLYNNGIIAQYQDNLVISKNQVFNVISNISPIGIYAEGVTNSTIEKNNIHDVVYNGASYIGSSGITLKSLSNNPNVMIRNNVILHMAGMGSSPNTGDYNNIPAGLKLFGNATGGINIYNNSVYMPKDPAYGVFYNNEWFTALEIGAGISGVVLKNNILQSSVGEWPNSNLTSWGYSVYIKGTPSPFASINNNLYFTSNYDNNYVGLNGTVAPPVNNMNLAAWRTYTGQDAQSLNADPLFTSATNLIPQVLSPAIGAGLSCPGIVDDDIAGNARGASTTIGAYEMVTAPTKTLNLTLQLQGLYNGSGVMRTAWDQAGPHWGTGVADHIAVELHDAAPGNYASILYTASDVALSTSGQASAFIPAGLSGTYYITVKHRNGLPTVIAAPVSFAGTSVNYAFDLPAK
ncbi:MAG: BNR-repeat neuraminidase N-terminal domain-containing protein, partial [Bacteroidota bacterium]